MKFPVLFFLFHLLASSLFSQTHEKVTFRHEVEAVTGSVFVSGDLPELGNLDWGKSIELVQIDNGIWEIDVSLPVNRTYQYQFLARNNNSSQAADPAHGTVLTELVSTFTTTVVLDPTTKSIGYRGLLTNPVLNWRQGTGNAFQTALLSPDGDWLTIGAVGEANRAIEFFFTSGAEREPAGEVNYSTKIDSIFIQDSEVFSYPPDANISAPRRDYDPSDLPFVTSEILGEDRPYRVFLPRGYDEHKSRYYPVLYCLDGQRIFEESIAVLGDRNPQEPLDQDGLFLSKAIQDGLAQEAIIVGVDIIDFREYFGRQTPYQTDGIPGEYKEFADFLRLELVPEISEKYRTLAGPKNAAVMGFEGGAKWALYLGWDFSSTFGKVGLIALESQPGLTNVIALDPARKVKLSIDAIKSDYSKSHELRNILAAKSTDRFEIGENLRYLFQTEELTDFEIYRSRLPGMLSFLFPATEGTENTAANAANPFWLTFYGLHPSDWDLDGDVDGWSTRQEYQFGTNPIDPTSFPDFSLEVDASELVLEIQSSPGVRYQLQESFDLLNWDLLGDTLMGTGEEFLGLIEFEDSSPEKAFYRFGVEDPIDTDRDGLSDIEEAVLLGTQIDSPDTDRDGFPDGEEVLILGTDPLVPDFLGGSISGQVFLDQNADSNLEGETPVPGASVFLDRNYNGRRDEGEDSEETDSTGSYQFLGVKPGLYHVIQTLPPGSVQTFPGRLPGQPDGLADRIVSLDYVPIPESPTLFGQIASDDHGVPAPVFPSRPRVAVEPELTLKPIGNRARAFALGIFNTTEYASLTKDSVLTVEFEDEEIIDGPGYDFQVVSLDNVQDAGEKIEVWVGASPEEMIFLSVIGEAGGTGIDLGRYGIDYPIRFVRIKSLNNNGSAPGYDFVGFQAINFQPVSVTAHFVEVKPDEDVAGINFGRFGRDLPPRVVISREDSNPLAGGQVTIGVSASDDFDEPAVTVTANGTPVVLDGEGNATISTPFPGEMVVTAMASDSAGQSATQSLHINILNADGSRPNNPKSPSFSEANSNAPTIVVHSPGAGDSLSLDTPVIASISHANLSSWKLEFAPVDLIDPYQLSVTDPDYLPLGDGTESVNNLALADFPASTLEDGIYFLRISATANGITGYSGQVIAVRTDSSELFPSIEITAPAQNSLVSYLTEIEGKISSASPIREWYVEYADATNIDITNLADTSGANFVRFADGVGEVDGKLATFDPTTIKNGTYLIKVTCWNDFGLGWTEGVVVNVCGEHKPGRLKIDYIDLEADLAGIPIQIMRTYDSFEKDKTGDFGSGWSMSLVDPDIRDTDPDGGAAFTTQTWRVGTRIYLNSPEGKRIGFTFGIEPSGAGFLGNTYRGVFTSDPGVYEELELPERDLGFLVPNPDGTIKLSFIGLPFNPDVFILTTKDGTEYTYDETEGLLDVRDKIGNTLIFTDDSIRHSSGASIQLERDALSRITKITGPGGAEWNYQYDANGDLISVSDPASVETIFAYDQHYLTTITDPLGRQGVRYEFDEAGRLSAVIDENGNRSEQTWDLEGFSGTRTDYRGNLTTIHYNERGNILREISPNGGETIFEYADSNNPDLETSITDPLGNKQRYEYDSKGNKTRDYPATGNSFRWTYDEENRLSSIGRDGESKLNFSFNDQGLLTEVLSGTNVLQTYTYTADGRISAIADRLGNERFYRYEGPFGRLDRFENSLGEVASIKFSANGLPESATDLYGEDQYVYDASGRLLSETNELGNTVNVTYAGDQVESITDPNGIQTDYTYDTNNSLTSESIGAETIAYKHDPDGNRTEVLDALGNKTNFIYDAGGRVLSETDPLGNITTHSYDLAGNRTETIDRLGRKRSFEYDANNRLAAERWHASDDSVIREILFGYNKRDYLDEVIDGDLLYTFSSVNTMSVTFPGAEEKTIRYQYDSFDRLLKQSYGVTNYHNIERNLNGDATLLKFKTGDSDVTGRADLLRGPGRKPSTIHRYSSSTSNSQDALISTTLLTYDATGELSSLRHLDSDAVETGERNFTRNPGGQITATDDETIAYGLRGEIASVARTGEPIETFNFDAQGNPEGAGFVVGPGNRLTTAGEFNLVWDAEGNLTKRTNSTSGEVVNLSWDYRNRLTKVEIIPLGDAPKIVEYEYDFRDLRIARTEDGQVVYTLYDRNKMPFLEFEGLSESPSAIFFYAPDVVDHFLAEWRQGIGMRWFLTDHIGSIRTVLDHEGTVVGTRDFGAFGKPIAETGSGSSLGFSGRHTDPTTGLNYHRARFYDPLLGRFISEDPIGFESGDVNLYRYARNDPFNLVDPSGNTAAVSYSTFTEKIAKRTIKYAQKVGRNLEECFTGIANSLEQAAAGGGAGGGDVGKCSEKPGLP